MNNPPQCEPPLKLVWMSPSDLAENPQNWRTHPESQAGALSEVIGDVGWAGVCLVNSRTNRLIDGHLRKKIALARGDERIPVLIGDWSEEQEKRILLTLDPIGSMATASKEQLDALLREVSASGQDTARMLQGIAKANKIDWAAIATANPAITAGFPSGQVIEDEVPEPPAIPVVQTGELWLLGEHRLLCGDATNPEDVQRILNGSKVSCVFTDPPYGVSVAAKNRLLNTVQPSGRCLADVVDDDLSPEDLEARLLPAFVNIRELAMADDCTVFLTAPQGGELGMMMMMMQKAGLKVRHVLIWVKNQPTFSMGRLDYDYQHEPILLTWLARHKRPMAGQHRTSIWPINKPRASPDHPTMKPVALYANAYLNNSDQGDCVFDPYCGSGTAFAAAEQVGRKCRGIEVEPKYCDVTLQRWQSLTGKQAIREDGIAYDTLRAEANLTQPAPIS